MVRQKAFAGKLLVLFVMFICVIFITFMNYGIPVFAAELWQPSTSITMSSLKMNMQFNENVESGTYSFANFQGKNSGLINIWMDGGRVYNGHLKYQIKFDLTGSFTGDSDKEKLDGIIYSPLASQSLYISARTLESTTTSCVIEVDVCFNDFYVRSSVQQFLPLYCDLSLNVAYSGSSPNDYIHSGMVEVLVEATYLVSNCTFDTYDINASENYNDSITEILGDISESGTENVDLQKESNKLQEESNILQSESNELLDKSNELQEESNETQKNIFEKITDFFDNFFSRLGDFLLGLIVPSAEDLTAFLDEVNAWFSDRLGFIWYPFGFAVDAVSALAGGDANTQFTVPALQINMLGGTYTIWNEMSVDIDAFDIFKYVRLFTSFICVGGIVALAYNKWDEWIGGHGVG